KAVRRKVGVPNRRYSWRLVERLTDAAPSLVGLKSRAMNSRLLVLFLVWSAILSLTFAVPCEQAVPTAITAMTSRLHPSRRLDATNRLHLTVGLPLRNPKQLEQLLGQISVPDSHHFRRTL